MGTQRGRESFSANDPPHGKRVTRKRLPTPFARFHQEICGRVLKIPFGGSTDKEPANRTTAPAVRASPPTPCRRKGD